MFCHSSYKLGLYFEHVESLYEPDGQALRWLEHPQGRAVDVVAVPLRLPSHCRIFPLDLALADADLEVKVAMAVSIVGYPKGLTAGGVLPIWKTGHLASEPDLNYEYGRPAFLIDATTRIGMSGSPVVLRVYRHMTHEGVSLRIDHTNGLGSWASTPAG